MTLEEYEKESARTDNYEIPKRIQALIYRGTSTENGDRKNVAHLMHCALGLSGESGEISDAIIKHVCYGRPLDTLNIKEELGDCMWFIRKACAQLGCTIGDIMQMNVDKLKARYPEQYTHEACINRDLENERKVMLRTGVIEPNCSGD